jgi:hypothetical protein
MMVVFVPFLHRPRFQTTKSPKPLTHTHSTMIYDVNSPQFQQFMRATTRRREDLPRRGAAPGKGGKAATGKPGGAASTGL